MKSIELIVLDILINCNFKIDAIECSLEKEYQIRRLDQNGDLFLLHFNVEMRYVSTNFVKGNLAMKQVEKILNRYGLNYS